MVGDRWERLRDNVAAACESLGGSIALQTRLTWMSTCFDVFKSAIALATDERCSRAIAFSTDERSSAAAFWRQMAREVFRSDSGRLYL